ncbi:MAG: hypothetical protein MJZ50_03800 [Treponema sp.]|nr:hypothetical protein [Treponema sp.]
MYLTEYELKLLKEQLNESDNVVSDVFLVATDNLRKDIHEFYKLFGNLRIIICPSGGEKVEEGIEERAQELLIDLKECSSRIQGDINTIKELINNKSLKLNCIDDANENIFDLSSTCNSVFERYNVFPKKEIPLLKNNLCILVDAFKELDDLIFKYNDNTTESLLFQPSLKFDLIKKIIDSEIDITAPLPSISLDDFCKIIPKESKKFVSYLDAIKDKKSPRNKIQWKEKYNEFRKIFK